jgi:hypothetical protein
MGMVDTFLNSIFNYFGSGRHGYVSVITLGISSSVSSERNTVLRYCRVLYISSLLIINKLK